MQISLDTSIEELVAVCIGVSTFLINKGLPCVVCGEPFWGSLWELCEQEGWSKEETEALGKELEEYVNKECSWVNDE